MPEKFYPPLSAIVEIPSFPNELGFIQDTIQGIFDSLYFKDLQYSTSKSGDEGFYSLTLISYVPIGFEIPDADLGIYLNPPPDQAVNGTWIPMTLAYRWPILGFVDGFSLDSFLDDPKGIFNLIVQKMGLDPHNIVESVIEKFVSPTGNPLQNFINEVKAHDDYDTLNIPTGPSDPPVTIDSVIAYIEEQFNTPVAKVLYDVFIVQGPGALLDKIGTMFSSFLDGKSIIEYVRDLLIPEIDAMFRLNVAIDIPHSVLVPVNPVNPDDHSRITLQNALLYFSTKEGIGVDAFDSISFTESYIGNTGMKLSATGIKLDLSRKTNIPEAVADGRTNDFIGVYIEEAKITLPDFWAPVTTTETSPDYAQIIGKNLLIGTGGLSGTLSIKPGANNTSGLFKTTFGGFSLALKQFDVQFRQNAVVRSNILGEITIPPLSQGGTETKLQIKVTLTDNGFKVALTDADGVFTILLPEIFQFDAKGLEIGSIGGRFFIGTSGDLTILAKIPVIDKPILEKPVGIKKLIIWENGQIDFEAGSIPIPTSVSLKVGPVELSITNIHIGSYKRKLNSVDRSYKFFGFDGGVKTGVGGVDARGDGIKFYFTTDGLDPVDSFLRIEGIGIDITIPGGASPDAAAVILEGWLSMRTPSDQAGEESSALTEYGGGISLEIPKLDIKAKADMRLIPSTGAFLVDAALELSTPILIGATGLGIYGFRLLLGNQYVASKAAAGVPDGDWWDYYKAPKKGVNFEKFAPQKGFAFGAGISLATAGDEGKTFSSKFFLMISLPGLFMLEGQATIMSKRLGLENDADPPFYAAIMITDEGFRTGITVDLKIPEGGEILDLHGEMRMYFPFSKGSAWYLNIGEETPKSKRITSKVLKLVEMHSYLMLSSSGIRAGAGAGWDFEKDFEIARIAFGVSVDVGGFLSFSPVQIGGHVDLAGYCELSVFGIGFRLDLSAHLEAEAPRPFVIAGSFRVTLGLPWPLPDIDVSLSLSWRENEALNLDETGVLNLGRYGSLTEYNAAAIPVKALNMMSGEPFRLNYVNRLPSNQNVNGDPDPVGIIPSPGTVDGGGTGWIGNFSEHVIPVDSYIDVEFKKGMRQLDSFSLIAKPTDTVNSKELIPPQKGPSAQVEHDYVLKNITIWYWKPTSWSSFSLTSGQWVQYKMKELNTPLLEMLRDEYPTVDQPEGLGGWAGGAPGFVEQNVKFGYWQMTEPGKYTKLRVFGRTPLELNKHVSPINAGFPTTTLICPPKPLPPVCQNWLDKLNQAYAGGRRHQDRKLAFTVLADDAKVINFPNVFGGDPAGTYDPAVPSLRLKKQNRIEIFFPNPTALVKLKLSTVADKVTISYYRGYAWAPPPPPPPATTTEERTIDSWEVIPETPASVDRTSLWAKLRAIPAFYRTFCTGTFQTGGAGASVAGLLAEFWPTHYYMRQIIALPAPTVGTFEDPLPAGMECQELLETLHALAVAQTGSIGVPVAFEPNVEHFHLDMTAYMNEHLGMYGQPAGVNATANAFYEKWFGLISCIGTLYDSMYTLTGVAQEKIRRVLNPEVARLYRFAAAKTGPSDFDLVLNTSMWLWDARDQLRSVAGFFAVLGLDFAKIVSKNAEGVFASYFTSLERAYLQVMRTVRMEGGPSCGGPGCGRTKELAAIARRLCVTVPNPTTSPAVGWIDTLVTDSATVTLINDLLEHFGWKFPPVAGADYCARLRRLLAVMILSYSVYDELSFAVRYRLDDVWTRLKSHVARYIEDVGVTNLPTVNATTDAFVTRWLDALTCLCKICTGTNISNDDRLYLESTLDPEIDTLYGKIAEKLYTALPGAGATDAILQMHGTAVADDVCDQIRILNEFFVTAMVGCDFDAGVQTLLTSTYASAFNAAYTTFDGFLAAYRHCTGGGTGFAITWLPVLEELRTYMERRWELPSEVGAPLDGLLDEVKDIHTVVYGSVAVPLMEDEYLWKLGRIITHFENAWLQGNDVSTTVQNDTIVLMNTINSVLTTIYATPEFAEVDISQAGSRHVAEMQSQLRDLYVIVCHNPGDPLPTPWPTKIVDLITDFEDTLNHLVATFGLDLAPMSLDPCVAFGHLIKTLMIAYGRLDELSLATIAKMKAFVNDLQTEIYAEVQTYPNLSANSCIGRMNGWFQKLNCLQKVCRYRGSVGAVDTQLADTTPETIGAELRKMTEAIMLFADRLGLGVAPFRRAADRCRKLRVIANYTAFRGLDYAGIDADTNLTSVIFANDSAFHTAWNHTSLNDVRSSVCNPEPQPYDPLMKREEKVRAHLLRELVYHDPDKPIDRITIDVDPTCDPGAVSGWPQSYWDGARTELMAEIIPDIQIEIASLSSSADLEEENAERLDELEEELERAEAFRDWLATHNTTSLTPCEAYVHEVCWQPAAAYSYNLNLPNPKDVRKSVKEMTIALRKVNQPIWRPNTYYAIQFETEEKVHGQKNYRRFYTFGFRTAGPIGHFHEFEGTLRKAYDDLLKEDREAEYPYTGLKRYIDYRRSYPNADGNIVGAKPLYYGRAKLNLFYELDYVVSMYKPWAYDPDGPSPVKYIHSGLELMLEDPANRPNDPPIRVEGAWVKDVGPRVPKEIRTFNNMVTSVTNADRQCLQIDPIAVPPARVTVVSLPELAPQKLYTAVYNARYAEFATNASGNPIDGSGVPVVDVSDKGEIREVHRYVFQTSRYPDFKTHIGSWILSAPDVMPAIQAIYYPEVTAGGVVAARGLLAGTATTPSVAEYPIEFERMVDGALGLGTLPPAETVEFNVIKHPVTEEVVGILVRSPEPFNDPKIPDDTPQMKALMLGVSTGFDKVIFSKDRTGIFISNANGLISTGTLGLTFSYVEFDGSDWVRAKRPVEGNPTQFEDDTMTVLLTWE